MSVKKLLLNIKTGELEEVKLDNEEQYTKFFKKYPDILIIEDGYEYAMTREEELLRKESQLNNIVG